MTQLEFEQWIDSHSTALYQRARWILGDVDQAKDAVQETFLAALQEHEKFRGESQVRTWLLGILRFKCMDQLRAQYKKQEREERYDTSIEDFCFRENGSWHSHAAPALEWKPWLDRQKKQMQDFLRLCMDLLPPTALRALRLQFLREENEEIQRGSLKISDANLWQTIRRAKLQLRACLESKGIEKEDLP